MFVFCFQITKQTFKPADLPALPHSVRVCDLISPASCRRSDWEETIVQNTTVYSQHSHRVLQWQHFTYIMLLFQFTATMNHKCLAWAKKKSHRITLTLDTSARQRIVRSLLYLLSYRINCHVSFHGAAYAEWKLILASFQGILPIDLENKFLSVRVWISTDSSVQFMVQLGPKKTNRRTHQVDRKVTITLCSQWYNDTNDAMGEHFQQVVSDRPFFDNEFKRNRNLHVEGRKKNRRQALAIDKCTQVERGLEKLRRNRFIGRSPLLFGLHACCCCCHCWCSLQAPGANWHSYKTVQKSWG